jgi:hypothetical protein
MRSNVLWLYKLAKQGRALAKKQMGKEFNSPPSPPMKRLLDWL